MAALIPEDGTGVENADSFASLQYADNYFSGRGKDALWTDKYDDDAKAAALRSATDYISAVYRGQWKGYRVYAAQSLDWPRTGAVVDGRAIPITSVPREVLQATCELAFRSAQGITLTPDITPTVKRKKVGDLEIEYTDAGAQRSAFSIVETLLGPLLDIASGTGFQVPMGRS